MAWIFNPLGFTLSNLPITKILQFGQGLYCSDAAASAAMYGFTAVDRSEGYLILAVVAMGDEVLELTEPKEVLCCWNPDPFLKVVIAMLFTEIIVRYVSYFSWLDHCIWFVCDFVTINEQTPYTQIYKKDKTKFDQFYQLLHTQ